ncbi:MAG: YcgL domain-containing protein [Porticoccaceae bacterium]
MNKTPGKNTPEERRLCKIYRSPKQSGMYLYVNHEGDLKPVPEALLTKFGKPELAMPIMLGPERKLARVDIADVLKALEEQGYYLQMPPRPDQYMADMRQKNEKLA